MFIITRLRICILYILTTLCILMITPECYGQLANAEKNKYQIPDSIYLLINEKSALRKITRKNNIYTQTSLLRLLEINGELCTFYISVRDEELVNILYNESYEIVEYLRKFHQQSEFYPAGLVRFAYFLYKVEEYKEALKTLETARQNKYLTEKDYVFAVKVNAQIHFELKNYQNVIDQFFLINDKYYDQLDDDLLLVYAKALLKRGSFTKAYNALTKFIKSYESRNKKFAQNLLDSIHVFFVEANKFPEGIKFLTKYHSDKLFSMSMYSLERNKDIYFAIKSFKDYFNLQKNPETKFKHLLEFLESLRQNGKYRYMLPFFKTGSILVQRKFRKKYPSYLKSDYINILFNTLSDHVKFNITPIYTRKLINDFKSKTNGFDAYLEYVIGQHYYQNKQWKSSFRAFEQSYRLSAGQNYSFSKHTFNDYPFFLKNRKQLISKSLNYLFEIYNGKENSFLDEDDKQDLYENYTTDYPRGKFIHPVFTKLVTIYFNRQNFDDIAFLIIDYLDKFPEKVDVYRKPISDLIDQIYRLEDETQREDFLEFVESDTFLERIYEKVSRSSTIAKAEFIFSLGLYRPAYNILRKIDESKIQNIDERNRLLILTARAAIKISLFKNASRFLLKYINSAKPYEFDKYREIILGVIEEFYKQQDFKTPYMLVKSCYKRLKSTSKSYKYYIANYLFSLIMNERPKEFISFIQN